MKTTSFFVFCLCAVPTWSYASGCNSIVRKQIHFDKGATCWSFRGKANSIVGAFPKNQLISVTVDFR